MDNRTKWLIVSIVSLVVYMVVSCILAAMRGNCAMGGEVFILAISVWSVMMIIIGDVND